MYKINDCVVYKVDVCKISDIHYNALKKQDYYVLIPIDDDSLKIAITINNNGYLKNLITKDKIFELINDIPGIKIIDISDRLIENEYRKLLKTYNHYDLVKIIKTTYLRNKERSDNKKKVSERDNDYFIKAEKGLYNDFGIVLNMSFDETRNFIIEKVESIL